MATQYIPTSVFSPDHQSNSHNNALDSISNLMILMGVPIENLSMEEALDRIEQFVQIGRQLETTHQIATVNVDFLVKSMEDPELHELLQHADLCTADGMPLVWGSKLLGSPLKERVTGSDMVPLLAERAAETGMTLYFMGGSEGSTERAKDILTAKHPKLQVVGHSCPYWKHGEAFDEAILDDIRQAAPDILLVALGNPKQEWWIKEYGEAVGVPVMIGVGASLDFVAGNVKRAPKWMQRIGFEWLGRLVQEPKRLWRRYLVDVVKFTPWMANRVINHLRYDPRPSELTVTANRIDNVVVVNVLGELSSHNSQGVLEAVKQSMLKGNTVTLNFADIKSMDTSALGALIEVKKLVERNRGELRVVGMSQTVARSMSVARLFRYFDITDHNLVYGYSG